MINSINEWDRLESVVVGSATGATVPDMSIDIRTVCYADVPGGNEIDTGPYPVQVVEEANEDLELLSKTLSDEGIEVIRPERKYSKPKYYDYCPRDTVLVYGDSCYSAPTPVRCRSYEYEAIPGLSKIIKTPWPHRLPDSLYNLDCIQDPDTLALTDIVPAFDAANILRANDHILYLNSNSGNKKGADALQEVLGPDVTVHLLSGIYSYMHLDSTIALLREGLMLLNPERIQSVDQLPDPFRSWDVIWCPEPIDIGYTERCNASKWINMNLFSISPDMAVLEENQTPLARKLEEKGITPILLPMRQQRTLGGGFHCVTLDLRRNHG